jgi:hypothetical protein
VTAGLDKLVKVWNFKKELIREIIFTEPLKSVLFSNQRGDLIVVHGGKISLVSAIDYKP